MYREGVCTVQCTCAFVDMYHCTQPMSYVEDSATEHKPNFKIIDPAIPEIWKRDVHICHAVVTTPTMNCVKRTYFFVKCTVFFLNAQVGNESLL